MTSHPFIYSLVNEMWSGYLWKSQQHLYLNIQRIVDTRTYGHTDIWTYGHTDIRTYAPTAVQPSIWTYGSINGQLSVRMSVCPYVHMSVCPYVRISTCAYIGHFTSLRLIINIKVLYHSKCSISTFPDAKILNIESYSAMINKFVGETSAVESR